ncbi:EamA family transporter [Deinococcus peraridilitoris]|uniref:Putative permease, DMT superfamily n=1 Tax=Deinococcus peraridilitoris (strain DSM 19664 / LMG 22246 / CIP 109416 / KR-200) TaxID=937777 RepID=K9ZWM5_DEIPD|nr:DMT family transporter [Deinococcus peraridilitoris]AFZ65986.1 putative permease, DMT superfamily [Deinococcus peraridilitoris DSM 19664]
MTPLITRKWELPPTTAVLMAIVSIQGGAALAKSLFPAVGPGGTSALRIGFAALILLAMWRPRLSRYSRGDLATTALFGAALGLMNLCFYASIERIPLGLAVTLEFVGPLGVAVFASRRKLDYLWAVLAGAGILLISPLAPGSAIDPLGVGLALLAGGFWAAYILVGARLGRAFSGGQGLALGMLVAALIALPFGVAEAGGSLLAPHILVLGLGVALLSSALPYSLEMTALRRLPSRTFSILMSLEPAVAAMMGFVLLHEALSGRQLLAMVLVIAASVGASLSASSKKLPPPEGGGS